MKISMCICGHSYLVHPDFGHHQPCSEASCSCLDFQAVSPFASLDDEVTPHVSYSAHPDPTPDDMWEHMARVMKGEKE